MGGEGPETETIGTALILGLTIFSPRLPRFLGLLCGDEEAVEDRWCTRTRGLASMAMLGEDEAETLAVAVALASSGTWTSSSTVSAESCDSCTTAAASLWMSAAVDSVSPSSSCM